MGEDPEDVCGRLFYSEEVHGNKGAAVGLISVSVVFRGQ